MPLYGPRKNQVHSKEARAAPLRTPRTCVRVRTPVKQPRSEGLVLHLASVRWWSALAYYALALAQGLERLGLPSGVAACPGSPLHERSSRLGLARPEWADLLSDRPDLVFRAALRLRAAIRAGVVRAVFVHTGPGHLAGALAAQGGPAPLLRVRAEMRRPAGGPISAWLYRQASDRTLISGEFMRVGHLERLRLDPRRVVCLPAGIDADALARVDRLEARRRLRASLDWTQEAPVVGMLARYSPVKGHEDLVHAARILAGEHPSARFLVAGPPGQTGSDLVRSWIEGAGLAGRFAALDSLPDPLQAAAALDVAVIASVDSEAVCRSALEYMALGIPIVATRVHVIPETVGDAGILVPPRLPGELAAAIGSLLDSPARGRAIGEIGVRRVRERFDLRIVAAQAARIVEEAHMERIARG
jgi:glycosyltransferase involved in cell wall biosynthesis